MTIIHYAHNAREVDGCNIPSGCKGGIHSLNCEYAISKLVWDCYESINKLAKKERITLLWISCPKNKQKDGGYLHCNCWPKVTGENFLELQDILYMEFTAILSSGGGNAWRVIGNRRVAQREYSDAQGLNNLSIKKNWKKTNCWPK